MSDYATMEDFSEEQKANALKFLKTYVSQSTDADSSQLRSCRQQCTVEELEAECLHMARAFLSGK